jgi:hypothetical protein
VCVSTLESEPPDFKPCRRPYCAACLPIKLSASELLSHTCQAPVMSFIALLERQWSHESMPVVVADMLKDRIGCSAHQRASLHHSHVRVHNVHYVRSTTCRARRSILTRWPRPFTLNAYRCLITSAPQDATPPRLQLLRTRHKTQDRRAVKTHAAAKYRYQACHVGGWNSMRRVPRYMIAHQRELLRATRYEHLTHA